MKRMLGLALLTLLAPGGSASGQQCAFQAEGAPEGYVTQLAVRVVQRCFGEAADTAALTEEILGQIDLYPAGVPETADEAEAFRDGAVASLERLDRSLGIAIGAAPPGWEGDLQTMRDELRIAKGQLASFDDLVRAQTWEYRDLKFFELGTGRWKVDFRAKLLSACDSSFNSECRAALGAASALIRHGSLVRQVLDEVVRARIIELHGELSVLDGQWDHYFQEGRSQYVWELVLNGALFRRTTSGAELAPPPRGQWILLHPGAGIEFVRTGEENNAEFNAIAVVDLLGYNRVTWRAGSVGSRLALGLSAIATVSLEQAGDLFGWGAMLHIRNTHAIGFAIRDAGDGRETTWILSTDLAELYTGASEKARKAFRF